MTARHITLAFAVRGISSSEKLVLLALANFANDEMQCWPSQARLAEDTGLGARTIWGALASLTCKGLVSKRARKRSDGTRATDVFTINLDVEPVANAAKSSRNTCEVQSQMLREPVAPVAYLTTFEPPIEELPIEEPISDANASSPQNGFANFWSNYPEKVGKQAALKAYERAIKRIKAPDPPMTIFDGLMRAKTSRKWLDGYIPNPATWLNQGRWEDQPSEIIPFHERSDPARRRLEQVVDHLASAERVARQRMAERGGG